ncbi:MAG: SDR family oxidoreductase [bacterium]
MHKIALVTGGSSGLGYEIAKCLLENGYNVCITSRLDSKLNRAISKLSSISSSAQLHSYIANVGNENDVSKLFQYITENNFEVDMVFNVAGMGLFGDPDSVSKEMIDKVFEANLVGTILLSSYALKVMKDKGGIIVNIMSTAAHTGKPQESVYCAAKWGARGYTEAIQAATKGTPIKVIAVYPGGMNTPFWTEDCGLSVDTSKFMNPYDVARIIVDMVITKDSAIATEIIINRIC